MLTFCSFLGKICTEVFVPMANITGTFDVIDDIDEEDGEETVEVMGVIAPAWAKDANGNSVNTSYIINGNTLTQSVEFDENSAFPIVADPTTTKYRKPDVALDWSATAYNIIPIVMNLDSIQIKVVATAKIGDKCNSTTFYVKPGDTKKQKIKWDLTTAYKQNITVHFKITANKRSARNKSMPGSRKLDSYLINSWTKSTFKSNEASINYHFDKHGIRENRYDNIKKYTSMAYSYRQKCKTGTGAKHKRKDGSVYYRWDFTSKRVYILLTKNDTSGKIITFGHYLK